MSDTSSTSSSKSSICPTSASEYTPTSVYHPGFRFRAHRHTPLSPCGRSYCVPLTPSTSQWKTTSQIQTCLTRPPLDGTMNPNNFIELEIAAELRTGNQKGAQLVVVKGNMVAKIYDPLYYPAIDQLYRMKKDVVKNADKDYCCESTAYHELSSSPLERKVIPEYYGSWVMELWQGGVRRQVPLILMEFIDGICMNDVDPKLLTEKQRNMIMNEALVAEAEVYHYGGVSHKDFHPRNIIISPSPFSHTPCHASEPRVVLIDFNIAEVCRLANYVPSKDKRPKMQNPIVRHWGQLNDFSVPGWIPWHEDLGNREWLWNMFKDDPRFVEVRKKEGSWRWPEEAGVDY